MRTPPGRPCPPAAVVRYPRCARFASIKPAPQRLAIGRWRVGDTPQRCGACANTRPHASHRLSVAVPAMAPVKRFTGATFDRPTPNRLTARRFAATRRAGTQTGSVAATPVPATRFGADNPVRSPPAQPPRMRSESLKVLFLVFAPAKQHTKTPRRPKSRSRPSPRLRSGPIQTPAYPVPTTNTRLIEITLSRNGALNRRHRDDS